jgi:hypothetical protein
LKNLLKIAFESLIYVSRHILTGFFMKEFTRPLICLICVFLLLAPFVSNVRIGWAAGQGGPPTPPGQSGISIAARVASPMRDLSWTSGAFPVVNGKTIYPPLAVPISPERVPGFSTHWYAGSAYAGSSQSATWVYTQIKTPASYPKSDEFYYVLASIWDNSGSYDQIAFSDTYGVWGLTYSWTSGSCSNPTYNYNPDAMNLNLATTYQFYIGVGGGYTWFEAFVGSTIVWYLGAPTGATALSVDFSYCGYYNYTNYVEVWQTHTAGGYPSYTFDFKKNQWFVRFGNWISASWNTFYAGAVPVAVSVIISGQEVRIYK